MNNIKANPCVTTTQSENGNNAAPQQTLLLRAFCLSQKLALSSPQR